MAILLVFLASGLDLLGWALGIPLLKSISPQWNSMKVVTALCLAMSAAALVGLLGSEQKHRRRTVVYVLSAVVGLVGLLTIGLYLANLVLGHEWFVAAAPGLGLFLAPATRMAFITAIIFLLLGIVLALLAGGQRRAADIGHTILFFATLLAYMTVVGYILNVEEFYDWLNGAVALPTALAFCVLCFGVFCVRPDTWLMRVFAGREAGAAMARRLLPALLILPLVIGWLRLHGEQAGLFDANAGVGLVAVTYAVCLMWLVWLSAWSVNRTDRERLRAEESLRESEEQLRRANAELEQRVNERTAQLLAAKEALEAEVDQRRRSQDELRRNYQALHDTEEEYRSLVTATAQIVWTTNAAGQVDGPMPLWCDFTGQSEEDVRGWGWIESLYPDDRERTAAIWNEAVKNRTLYDTEYRMRRHDGEYRYVAVRGVPVLGRDGAIREWVGTCTDITERRQAEEELNQHRQHLEELVKQRTVELEAANEVLRKTAEDLARSNRDLEQFAYVASHDLQEPLRIVAGYLQLLERRYKGQLDAEADEFINFTVDGAGRMQKLINDLLAYSRVGTQGKQFVPVDSQAVLDRALLNLRAAINESGAVVTHDPLPTVTGDAGQLVQLFQNLIANAVKFRGQPSPQIHVGVRRQDHHWVFSIKDNGIGIEKQYFDRIFVIFQRLHGRETYPGTGIGLAICKRIAERHGGKIWVESESGIGSTFHFVL